MPEASIFFTSAESSTVASTASLVDDASSVAFLLPHPASMDTAIDITKNNEAHFFNFLLTISFPPLFYT